MGEYHHHHDHDHYGDDHGSDNPKTYKKAGWIGLCGFLFEGTIGFAIAGSVGAVGDALHALMDAASFFISARHARLQHEKPHGEVDYERRSVVMQTVFLVIAIILMTANVMLGNNFVELSSRGMFIAALFGLGFNFWQMNVLGTSKREGMNRHEAARQHAFIDVLFSTVVLHGAILNFFIKVDGWMLAKVPAVLGLVFLITALFIRNGFVDFEEFHPKKKAGYVLLTLAGAVASVWLVMYGSEKAVDLTVGIFLSVAMFSSLCINTWALITWNKGGRKFVHVH